jgi:hypothetical protein
MFAAAEPEKQVLPPVVSAAHLVAGWTRYLKRKARRKFDGPMPKMRVTGIGSLCYFHGYFSWAPSSAVGMRRPKGFAMTTKVCPNAKCPVYAHFVYTVAMRCVLCRCDLQAAHRIETAPHPEASTTQQASPKSARTHAAR